MKILVVEDDVRLARVLQRGLSESGHIVDVERDGGHGESAAAGGTYDAIILDVMLPTRDGNAVARGLRTAGVHTPILMLTARDTFGDAVDGLNAGADDYLRKPFSFDELEARLRAITRRPRQPAPDLLVVDDLLLDLRTRTVHRGPRLLTLTARELAFLEYLMRNAGLHISRAMLEDALWERDRETGSNLIEVYIRRLRTKLSADGEPQLIHTMRGLGYRFGPNPRDQRRSDTAR
jgi:DNA-binding response OmpR family regulator